MVGDGWKVGAVLLSWVLVTAVAVVHWFRLLLGMGRLMFWDLFMVEAIGAFVNC